MTDRLRDNLYVKMFAEALQRFDSLFAIYDENQRLVFANAASYDAMPAYFEALKSGLTVHEATRDQLRISIPETLEEDLEALTEEFVTRQFSGDIYEVASTKNRSFQVFHEKINEKYTLGLGVDVTRIRAQQAEVEKLAQENYDLANTDQLTGLANRRRFIQVLENAILESRSNGDEISVGLVDLDGFKRINDVYGHSIGDDLLVSVADLAQDYIDGDTFLARLGGDEFALIVNKKISQSDLLSYGDALCDLIRQPQLVSGNKVSVSASLGWANYPKDGKTASELLRKSDFALYRSKSSNTSSTVIFSSDDESLMLRQSEITKELETADLEAELYVEFQPIHDAKRQKITAFEALLRWDSPRLGFIGPSEFIPLAEKTGHISALSSIALRKALETSVHWPKSIDLHFNISGIDLGKTDAIQRLIDIVRTSDYPCKSVVFEVTETAAIETFESISHVFDLLKENDLRLALDDFGIGFSSLSYLTLIPVTCLKVDKSFTERLKSGSDEEKILKTIKFLCENLEIECVVEGVEDQSQLDQLMSLDLHHIQGFHFSRSLKPEALSAYLMNAMHKPKNAPPYLIKATA